MVNLFNSGVAYAADLPSKPAELADWFSSGAATLFFLIVAAKYLWDWAHKVKEKHDSKHDEETKQLQDTVRKLENDLVSMRAKHDGCRVNELVVESKQTASKLALDIEKFTEKLSTMAMNWAAEMAKKEATITHIKDDVTELKTKLANNSVDDLRARVSKLDDKIVAAFEILDGKRAPR